MAARRFSARFSSLLEGALRARVYIIRVPIWDTRNQLEIETGVDWAITQIPAIPPIFITVGSECWL